MELAPEAMRTVDPVVKALVGIKAAMLRSAERRAFPRPS
jgi:hypothetical protein